MKYMSIKSEPKKLSLKLQNDAERVIGVMGGARKLDATINTIAEGFIKKSQEEGLSRGDQKQMVDGAHTIELIGQILRDVSDGNLDITDEVYSLMNSDSRRVATPVKGAADANPMLENLLKKKIRMERLGTTEEVLTQAWQMFKEDADISTKIGALDSFHAKLKANYKRITRDDRGVA